MTLAIDFQQGFNEAWADVARFIPKLVAFLLILIIGYFVAKLLRKLVNATLERVGFDRAIERGGVGRALEASKYDASDLVAGLVFWALILLVLQLAFGVWGDNPISDGLAAIIAYLPNVIVAILIIVIVTAIAATVRELIQTTLGGLSYGTILANGIGIAIIVIGVFAALDQLEVAPRIVTGLFYALLAIVTGSAIIAIGGGGIGPMRQRWQNMLDKYDAEKPNIQAEARGAKDRIAARADELKHQAQQVKDDAQTQPGATRQPRRDR